MEATPKPFVCKSPDCNMSFTNEDHLTVHSKKHMMSLHLGHDGKAASFVADQTPTPTRLIRNLDEIGLFEEIIVNPFDETFRRAVEAKSTATSTHNEVLTCSISGATPTQTLPTAPCCDGGGGQHGGRRPAMRLTTTALAADNKCTPNGGVGGGGCGGGDGETLNTPHVLPYHDVTVADCRHVTSPLDHTTTHRTLCETVEKWRTAVAQSSMNNNNDDAVIVIDDDMSRLVAEPPRKARTLRRLSREPLGGGTPAKMVVRASPTTTTDAGGVPLKMPKLVKLSAPLSNTQPAVVQQQTTTHTVLEVDHSDQPQDVPKLTRIVSPIAADSDGAVLIDLTTSTESVREKLKRQIAQKVSQRSDASTAPTLDTRLPTTSLVIGVEKIQPPATAAASTATVAANMGASNGERNRAAAQRYRSKVKEWKVQLMKTNALLEAENRELRAKLDRLNAMLLAHQSCSVTRAMAEGKCIPVGPPQVIISNKSPTPASLVQRGSPNGKRAIRPHRPANQRQATTSTTSIPVQLVSPINCGRTLDDDGDITANPLYLLVNQQHKPIVGSCVKSSQTEPS